MTHDGGVCEQLIREGKDPIPPEYVADFVSMLATGAITTRGQVLRAKSTLCRKHGLSRVPANYELLALIPDELAEFAEPLLRNKPVRTISGVAPVAVMTTPTECPHGRCAYCPGGVTNNSPQSYTGREPAALRAAMYEFDPYRQTRGRLEQLSAIGHRTDKVELIVMGGTFTARDYDYQQWFVKRCFDAMNGSVNAELEPSQLANEKAPSRCVGLTVETRPDWFLEEHIDRSMRLGATKVELGVQVLDDAVLKGVKRGHDVDSVAVATRRARDAGLKVCYHVMPGLPGSDIANDLRSFERMFSDERFRPDMLKLYPTLVVKGTELYDLWKSGEYSPLEFDDAVSVIAEMKRRVPPWVRILRIQRDIPVQLIEAGVRKSHLRELARLELERTGHACKCIRCREVGQMGVDRNEAEPDEIGLIEHSYEANGGVEHFVSYETVHRGSLVGYARLRCASDPNLHPARIRELHVYGEMTPINEPPSARWQHSGYGERLLSRCEDLAGQAGHRMISVTSGVGVRDYYRRLGYRREGVYMSKPLRKL